MKKILVDGSFIPKRITGVQRFNHEVLRRLAKNPELDITVAVAKDVDISNLDIEGLKFVRIGRKNNKYWQLVTLGKIAKKLKMPVLCMSNFSPLFKKDYLVLHDVTFLDKQGNNDFLWALAYRILVGYRIKKHKKIFTVSEFSRSRILHHYKRLKEEQVVVVGNGGGNWKSDVEEIKPELKRTEDYYLAVGSTTANKNFGYILSLAKNNPDKYFVVVGRLGGQYAQLSKELKNVEFTGYLCNESLYYLYRHCNAFILPSFYEGFGLPPLEALYCGCRRLALSDIPVFREVYGGVANFFDTYDSVNTVDLEKLQPAPEHEAQRVLARYNWDAVAEKIFGLLE